MFISFFGYFFYFTDCAPTADDALLPVLRSYHASGGYDDAVLCDCVHRVSQSVTRVHLLRIIK